MGEYLSMGLRGSEARCLRLDFFDLFGNELGFQLVVLQIRMFIVTAMMIVITIEKSVNERIIIRGIYERRICE